MKNAGNDRDGVAMIRAVKGLVQRVLGTTCQFCDNSIAGPYVIEHVKVPGYTGRHKKAFCNERHLQAWQDYVSAWEDYNYKIPMSNTGPACGGC